MAPQTSQRKILVLRGPNTQDSHLLEMMGQCFEVQSVDSLEKALDLLRSQQFDAVVSETADFLPLERAVVSQQAVAILNTIGEGVCLVDGEGVFLWANRKLADFSEDVRQGVAERSRQAFEQFAKAFKACNSIEDKQLRPKRHSFVDDQDERYFEMIITPMFDSQHHLSQVATVIWEETASRRLQQRINAIDKAGRELVRLDADSFGGMTTDQRVRLIQDKVIRYAKEMLHFDHFVVRLLNKQTNQLEVLIGVGLENDERAEIFANIHNNGVTGYVAATGRSYICNSPHTDDHYLPGLDGARCSLTVPLRLHDQVIGTMNVESDKSAAFSEEDRQVAEIFGRHIAIALNILDLLVVERYKTTGQTVQNFTEHVSEPLNNIINEASLMMEEYIGHDDLRHRLQNIIDHVTRVKESVRDIQAFPKGILVSGRKIPRTGTGELTGKRVLVVDDEQFIRQTIADVVGKHGCTVDTARDGREAIAMIGQQNYDLVISDIKLPHANGYEIFASARNADKQIPVILMTGFGYDPNHSIVRANKEGLTAVLYKPFKVDQLMTEVHQALKITS